MTYLTSIKTLVPLCVVVVGLLAYNFIGAQWAGPTASAPNSNTEAPINESVNYQPKFGALGAFKMRAGEYCDAAGLNCYPIASLAGGGGAGVTQINAGTGILLSPTTITSTGTITVNTSYIQRRVATTCPVGTSIRQINPDGSVICQVSTPPINCVKNSLRFSPGAGCRLSAVSPSCPTSSVRHLYDVCQANGTWVTQFSCQSFTGSNVPAYNYPACP